MVDMTSTEGETTKASDKALMEIEIWRDLFKSFPANKQTSEQT